MGILPDFLCGLGFEGLGFKGSGFKGLGFEGLTFRVYAVPNDGRLGTQETDTRKGMRRGPPFKHCVGVILKDFLAPTFYNPPEAETICGIWGSYSNMPKAIFYLLKADYTPKP